MRTLLLLCSLSLCLSTGCAQETFVTYFNQARAAYKSGDLKKFYDDILRAHKLHPYHQAVLYQAGIAAALNHRHDEAVDFLSKAIHIKADFDLSLPELKSLAERTDFQNLKDRQIALLKPVINSDTALVVGDRTLHIESITPGEQKNVFYLGSIHQRKIVRIAGNGTIEDFTHSGQDGLCSVFGVRSDPSKKVLWACSSPTAEMIDFDPALRSAVYKYDIASRKLVAKYSADEPTEHQFGDLALDRNGRAFISDGKNNIVFIVNESTGKLERFFTSPEFWNIQGLAFSDDGNYLFIADYIKGIFRLDLRDKSLMLVPAQFPLALKSVDGLLYFDQSLIAIQNLVVPMRVVKISLNKAHDTFTACTVIDNAHPAFNEPTLGCLVNKTFYYVANSLWSGYDKERRLKPIEQLQDAVILKTDLNKLK